MVCKTTKAACVEQKSSDMDITEMNHQIVGVEFLPEEPVEQEARPLPLRVRFSPTIPMTEVVRSEEAKQAFLNKRKQHDFGFFRVLDIEQDHMKKDPCGLVHE